MPNTIIERLNTDLKNLANAIQVRIPSPELIGITESTDALFSLTRNALVQVPETVCPSDYRILAIQLFSCFEHAWVGAIRSALLGHIDEAFSNMRRALELFGSSYLLLRLAKNMRPKDVVIAITNTTTMRNQLGSSKIPSAKWLTKEIGICAEHGAHGNDKSFSLRILPQTIRKGVDGRMESRSTVLYCHHDPILAMTVVVKFAEYVFSVATIVADDVIRNSGLALISQLDESRAQLNDACKAARLAIKDWK